MFISIQKALQKILPEIPIKNEKKSINLGIFSTFIFTLLEHRII